MSQKKNPIFKRWREKNVQVLRQYFRAKKKKNAVIMKITEFDGTKHYVAI